MRKFEDRRKKRDYKFFDLESDEEQISDLDIDFERERKRKFKFIKIFKKSFFYDSDDLVFDSDGLYRGRRKEFGRYIKVYKRYDLGSEFDYKSSFLDYRITKLDYYLRKSRYDFEDEYDIGVFKRRIVIDREEEAENFKNKKFDLDRDDYGRKYNDRYYIIFVRLYYDDGFDFDSEREFDKRVSERSRRSRRYDIDESDYGLDYV